MTLLSMKKNKNWAGSEVGGLGSGGGGKCSQWSGSVRDDQGQLRTAGNSEIGRKEKKKRKKN
jgi:hypothetical protein